MIIEDYTITDSSTQSALRRIPDGLEARLFPYQHIGFTRLCGFAAGGLGGLLADEMGLGKTLQAIALLVELGERAIVVAPASLLENWQREIERFAPAITVFRHAGGERPGVSSRCPADPES
jgi:SNF2 family DNA or RNA helicase